VSSGQLVVGLMSGTSLDGIDAALVRFEGSTLEDFEWTLMAFESTRYGPDRQALLLQGMEEGTPAGLCRLNASLGEWMAAAVLEVCEGAGVTPTDLVAVGCHGHTIWHIPPAREERGERGERGATFQLGDPATIAELTGAAVVSDFRSRDVAAGGHGAPMVTWPDWLLYSAPDRRRAVHNMGGISNVTWLPPSGSEEPLLAFDTGPGMGLVDEATRRATRGDLPYDVDGALARVGRVDEALLDRLLDDDYFRAVPPKTTGRERYGRDYVARLAEGLRPGSDEAEWRDLIATLTALTARTVGEAYRTWVLPRGLDEVFLMGGGSRNPVLVEAIAAELAPIPVMDGGELGVDPDAREALAFAVLTWAHLHGVACNAPDATGARGPRVLGSLTPGRQGS